MSLEIGRKIILIVKNLRVPRSVTGCVCMFVPACIVSAPLGTANCWLAAAKVV